MALFTSVREKRFWIWAFLVFLAIYASLLMGRPLANQLRDQNIQAVFFVAGMLLATASVIVHGIVSKPGKIELAILLGIIAVYLMFIFRLGAPERSHVIEYSVLAIFMHKALLARAQKIKPILAPALMALVGASLIGVVDESLQLFLPNRVFDPIDILFNVIAVIMAIGAGTLLTWIRRRVAK